MLEYVEKKHQKKHQQQRDGSHFYHDSRYVCSGMGVSFTVLTLQFLGSKLIFLNESIHRDFL